MQRVRLLAKDGETVVKEYDEDDEINLMGSEDDQPPILNLDGRFFTYLDFITGEEDNLIVFKETDCHPVSGAIVVT